MQEVTLRRLGRVGVTEIASSMASKTMVGHGEPQLFVSCLCPSLVVYCI